MMSHLQAFPCSRKCNETTDATWDEHESFLCPSAESLKCGDSLRSGNSQQSQDGAERKKRLIPSYGGAWSKQDS